MDIDSDTDTETGPDTDATGAKRTTVMVLRMLPDKPERLLPYPDGTLMFNVAAFRNLSGNQLRKEVRRTFREAESIAGGAEKRFAPKIDFKSFTNDMVGLLDRPEFGDEAIAPLLFIITEYRKCWRAADGREAWRDSPQYPEYDIQQHPSFARYGNVELRVVEDFLLAPDALRAAMERIAEKTSSEEEMYAPSESSGVFIHDSPDWNIRRLMTNAGFYVGADPDAAWKSLKEWAERYISALSHSHLSWQNTKAFYYLRVQRALHEASGYVPKYVELPGHRRIYQAFAGRDVLFASPLFHIVNEQISSGHIWKLYKDYDVPAFSARAVPAFVSTWPNRPHTDWSETFARMCDSLRAAHAERPFDVFVASCGCYGLPICDFARTEFGCATFYIGHQAHKLFGILPVSSEHINPEMWAASDLGKYPNVDRIDRGRYLKTGR